MTSSTSASPSPATTRFPVLLFDLDGTLIDSAPDLAAALNRVLAVAGRQMLPFARVRSMVGNGAAKLVERGFEATGGPPDDLGAETERFLAIYGRALACHTRVYDGVVDTLDRLAEAGHALAIATNKPLAPTLAVLDALDLARFFPADHVVGGDSFAEKKPAPDPLLGLLGRIGAAPEASVMIGDSHNDVEAARAAGIAAVAVGYGYCRGRPEDLGADALIQDFAGLPMALDGLARRSRP
ncbi:phosphoglycolate phosphatase [Marivibrio halodurans]|uniref:Phosphoglycolate phosphatase n=1 Tax=Marivibrio halodurans TaxID=2039722 RepID=A0A8J7SJC1_9PROT|nr:phosphoglycolate phosphatase [Marivibrio halodurans]MBP5857633.1 phosphoglycolate phosphatase [Marivibrio halodurans]